MQSTVRSSKALEAQKAETEWRDQITDDHGKAKSKELTVHQRNLSLFHFPLWKCLTPDIHETS